MRLIESSFLADENIQPDVVAHLLGKNIDIITVFDANLAGKPDHVLLEEAAKANRIIITHDADFGNLAVFKGLPCRGILYLRPGHIASRFVIEMLTAVFDQSISVEPGTIIIAQRQNDSVTIRIRR